eukprot:PhM_4_TR18062/c1_g1_i3/m.78256
MFINHIPRTSPVQNIFGGALACALPPEYMDVAMTKIQHHSHSKTNDDDGPLGDNEEMYVHAPTDSRIHIELLEALPLGVGTGGDTAPAHTTADTRGVNVPTYAAAPVASALCRCALWRRGDRRCLQAQIRSSQQNNFQN